MKTTSPGSTTKNHLKPSAQTPQEKPYRGGTANFQDHRSEALFQQKVRVMVESAPQTAQMRKVSYIINPPSRTKNPLQCATHSPLQFVTDEEVKEARDACNGEAADSVELYSKGWKKKPNATKKQVFERVHANESKWFDNVDHIMKGEATTPPAGYHSKALDNASNAEGVGTKSPSNVGGKGVYKQWTKRRGQAGNANLKISTFFPDNWDEKKVRACALLSFAGADHQMTDQLPLDSPGDATFYPNTALGNPDQP